MRPSQIGCLLVEDILKHISLSVNIVISHNFKMSWKYDLYGLIDNKAALV